MQTGVKRCGKIMWSIPMPRQAVGSTKNWRSL